MNYKYWMCMLVWLWLFTSSTFASQNSGDSRPVKRDTLTWLDNSRARRVPVAIYQDPGTLKSKGTVVLSPGYPGKSTDYAYIANDLAKQGYLVMVVQHNLATDGEMPSGENLYQRRMPFWATGVANILFAVRKLKLLYAAADTKHLILIGHSNGGDICLLMTTRYPKRISKVITLDNRRMPMPRQSATLIYSIRSKDQPADAGVLPTAEEQAKYHITIIKADIAHDDMGGSGNNAQLNEINALIKQFLQGRLASLRDTISRIAATTSATVGVAVQDLQTKEMFVLNGGQRFPMQSVFKFPLAMYILHQVDLGKLNLAQPIYLSKKDVEIPYASPLHDKYPAGNVNISLAELLAFTVSQSDNNGCDRLFKLAGGTQVVNIYLHQIGIKDIAVVATEKEMGGSPEIPYRNWCRPEAMLDLLQKFNAGSLLSKTSNAFLWHLMLQTVNAPNRIKGLLPPGTVVAHKPGTSGTTTAGFTATTNDVGIVELPDKRRFAIVLFVCDATADQQTREGAMARITKVVYDSF